MTVYSCIMFEFRLYFELLKRNYEITVYIFHKEI